MNAHFGNWVFCNIHFSVKMTEIFQKMKWNGFEKFTQKIVEIVTNLQNPNAGVHCAFC